MSDVELIQGLVGNYKQLKKGANEDCLCGGRGGF